MVSDSPTTAELSNGANWTLVNDGNGKFITHSQTDSRWNTSVQVDALFFSGGMPNELKSVYEQKKKEYGEPPKDLGWGGMKD